MATIQKRSPLCPQKLIDVTFERVPGIGEGVTASMIGAAVEEMLEGEVPYCGDLLFAIEIRNNGQSIASKAWGAACIVNVRPVSRPYSLTDRFSTVFMNYRSQSQWVGGQRDAAAHTAMGPQSLSHLMGPY